jgi:hypothetical protein
MTPVLLYELEKEAKKPSKLREWAPLILGAHIAVGGGPVVAKASHEARGLRNVPAMVAAKVRGAPFDGKAVNDAREAALRVHRPPPVVHADTPKLLETMKKRASIGEALGHATEIAGLGVLAKPSLDRLRGKKVDERKASKQELAGLGILALPSALHLSHSVYKKLRRP